MKKLFVFLLLLSLFSIKSQGQALQVVQYNLNKTGQCDCKNTNTVFMNNYKVTTPAYWNQLRVRNLQMESSMVFDRFGVFERQIQRPQQVKQYKIKTIQFQLWRF